jgi:hypothetical protein
MSMKKRAAVARNHNEVVSLKQALANRRLSMQGGKGSSELGVENRDHLTEMKAIFDRMDIDGSGDLTIKEFRDGVQEFNAEMSEEKVKEIFVALDADNSGTLSIDEFLNSQKLNLETKFLQANVLMAEEGLGLLKTASMRRHYVESCEKTIGAVKQGVRLQRTASTSMDPKKQGDFQMLLPIAMQQRTGLKNSSELKKQIRALWDLLLPGKSKHELSKSSYLKFHTILHKLVDKNVTDTEAEHTAESDWTEDMALHLKKDISAEKMPYQTFFDSMFNLCDTWCDTTQEEEYVAFMHFVNNSVKESLQLLAQANQARVLINEIEAAEEADMSQNEEVQGVVHEIFLVTDSDGDGEVGVEEYSTMFLNIHAAMEDERPRGGAEAREENEQRIAQLKKLAHAEFQEMVDLRIDGNKGAKQLDRETFEYAWFHLTNEWTVAVSVRQYILFLHELLHVTTNTRETGIDPKTGDIMMERKWKKLTLITTIYQSSDGLFKQHVASLADVKQKKMTKEKGNGGLNSAGSVEQEVPTSSIEQEVPTSSVEQEVPTSSIEQEVPTSSVEQEVPVAIENAVVEPTASGVGVEEQEQPDAAPKEDPQNQAQQVKAEQIENLENLRQQKEARRVEQERKDQQQVKQRPEWEEQEKATRLLREAKAKEKAKEKESQERDREERKQPKPLLKKTEKASASLVAPVVAPSMAPPAAKKMSKAPAKAVAKIETKTTNAIAGLDSLEDSGGDGFSVVGWGEESSPTHTKASLASLPDSPLPPTAATKATGRSGALTTVDLSMRDDKQQSRDKKQGMPAGKIDFSKRAPQSKKPKVSPLPRVRGVSRKLSKASSRSDSSLRSKGTVGIARKPKQKGKKGQGWPGPATTSSDPSLTGISSSPSARPSTSSSYARPGSPGRPGSAGRSGRRGKYGAEEDVYVSLYKKEQSEGKHSQKQYAVHNRQQFEDDEAAKATKAKIAKDMAIARRSRALGRQSKDKREVKPEGVDIGMTDEELANLGMDEWNKSVPKTLPHMNAPASLYSMRKVQIIDHWQRPSGAHSWSLPHAALGHEGKSGIW